MHNNNFINNCSQTFNDKNKVETCMEWISTNCKQLSKKGLEEKKVNDRGF